MTWFVFDQFGNKILESEAPPLQVKSEGTLVYRIFLHAFIPNGNYRADVIFEPIILEGMKVEQHTPGYLRVIAKVSEPCNVEALVEKMEAAGLAAANEFMVKPVHTRHMALWMLATAATPGGRFMYWLRLIFNR